MHLYENTRVPLKEEIANILGIGFQLHKRC